MKALFPIIPNARMWVAIWLLILIGWFALFFANQRYSIQFTGWVEMVIDAAEIPAGADVVVTKALTDNWFVPGNVTLGKKDEFATLLVQLALTDDTEVQKVTDLLRNALVEGKVIASVDSILEQSIIWPSIGEYMKKSALTALWWGMLLMAIYILFAFAAMRYLISPALLWVITVLTMLFDIAFPAGMYGIWMSMNQVVQVDAVFIIALLTIMGYSINDTIIIFDRVRENYVAHEEQFDEGKWDVAELFEHSLRQTMRRSLWTSLTTFLVVVAMWVFGTWSLKLFAFTFGMGVLSGSFSSIFFAAPLAYLFSQKTLQKKK